MGLANLVADAWFSPHFGSMGILYVNRYSHILTKKIRCSITVKHRHGDNTARL
jgi:hypothetical protein